MALRIETNAEPIPGYRLLERLGSGGFGEVWKAEAPGGLLKAIKIVRGDGRVEGDGGGLADQELKALRRVQSVRHPYLLSIDRYDVIDGHLLIVTELADGSLWDRWLACRTAGDAGLPRESLLRYLSEAAEVLDLMHTKHRLQHLDIKPQNLFLIHDHVKVADFGLVKDLHGVQGVITGGVTPFYAAPETFNDVVSKHCDQYSLAIVYCELLTGRRPFAGGSAQMVMVQHLQVEPNLDCLPECDRAAVARALAKSPEDRFPSCTGFVQALGQQSDFGSRIADCGLEEKSVDAGGPAEHPMRVPSVPSANPQSAITTVPTVVLGLGGVGGAVLQRLRAALQARGGDLARLRLLYVDTDADALTDAQVGDAGLAADEVLHLPLRRPGHYLKPRRDGRRPIDGWFSQHLLNRLARLPATHGARALGRLAFVDHDRTLNHALADCVRAAGETPRPQVIVLTSLAGGTGSGTCIDAAYLAQLVLERQGGSAGEVHGWLLVPPIRRQTPADVRASGNTLAALRELRHMSAGETSYEPIGTERAQSDVAAAPFASLTILPLDTSEAPGQPDGLDLAVRGLVRELLDPSRARRAEAESSAAGSFDLPYRTLGAIQFSWPRHAILDRAAVRTGQALVGQWLRTDASQVRDAIQSWFSDQWAAREFGPEHVSRRLQDRMTQALGQNPEAVLAELARPAADAPLTATLLHEWLGRIDEWVGRPPHGSHDATAGRFGDALLGAFRDVAEDWSGRLRDLALSVLEVPEFRLGGAETAARVAIDAAGRMSAHFKPLSDEWLRKAADARRRIDDLLVGSGDPAELAELAPSYANWRMHGMLVGRVAAVYQAAEARLTEVFDDLAVCRQQLESTYRLLQQVDAAKRAADPAAEAAGWLLPQDCRTIDDAANRVVHSISWEDAQELGRAVQESVARSLGGLLQVCRTAGDAPQRLSGTVCSVCRSFLTPRVDSAGAADAFVSAYGGMTAAAQILANAGDAATPILGADGETESITWELPPGPVSEELVRLAQEHARCEVTLATGAVDSIAVIRERRAACITELPQFGRECGEAFDLICRADGAAPHARFDIDEWVSVEPAMR